MEKINQVKKITPLDVARLLGVENEYKEVLFEQERKRNLDVIMGDVIQDEKNNINDNDDGK